MRRATHRVALQTKVDLDGVGRMPRTLQISESVWRGDAPPTPQDWEMARAEAAQRLDSRPASLTEPTLSAQARNVYLGRIAVPGRWRGIPSFPRQPLNEG